MTKTPIEILLVEDSPADALLANMELTDSPFGPFAITQVEGLKEALEQLRALSFDAVLLDLGLPDSQGLATLERIRNEIPHEIPIVILSGLDDEDLRLRALEEGAEDFLLKGDSAGNLRARSIRYAIERWRVHEAFWASAQQLSLAIDAADLGIFDLNLSSGRLSWSHHHARLFGLTPEQFGGTRADAERCVLPEDLPGLRESFDSSLAGSGEFLHEFRVVWPDESEHWIKARGKALYDNQEMPARLIGIVMDVSPRKAAEESERIRAAAILYLTEAQLTKRELALLKLLIAGMSNKQIALAMEISVQTVAKHRANLMAKMKARNAAHLVHITTLAGIA
jgi:two-component system, NarL family, sensor histidine kinase UhpB